MLEAECLDSTTLGVLAKLALHCRSEYDINVQIFQNLPSILRTLLCMGFDDIFDIRDEVPVCDCEVTHLDTATLEVDETRLIRCLKRIKHWYSSGQKTATSLSI